jgi:beta-phosphoglucomutase
MPVEFADSVVPGDVGPPKGVVFDMDGVLVDTESLKAQAHSRAVTSFGGSATPSLYEHCIGRSLEEVGQVFIQASRIAIAPEAYRAEFCRIYAELLQTGLQATIGSVALLTRLGELGYRLAVVTSSATWIARRVLAQSGMEGHFASVITADDVSAPKPAPDCYRLALERLHLRPDQAVAFEDSEAGVMAAAGAHLRVIAIRHRLNVRHRFGAADASLDSLGDTERVVQLIGALLRQDSARAENTDKVPSHEDDRTCH